MRNWGLCDATVRSEYRQAAQSNGCKRVDQFCPPQFAWKWTVTVFTAFSGIVDGSKTQFSDALQTAGTCDGTFQSTKDSDLSTLPERRSKVSWNGSEEDFDSPQASWLSRGSTNWRNRRPFAVSTRQSCAGFPIGPL
jgi:hypothetical protein